MRTLRDIQNVAGVSVLVRTACNVPVENGRVVNDYRLRKALPTIEFLAARGAKVILISHIGEAGTETLLPVYEALRTFIPRISFCPHTVGEDVRVAVRALPPGGVLLLENLRRDKREVANDPGYARELAALADVFVQDSFDTCHRLHASIVGIPALLPSYAGFLLEEEVAALSAALHPRHPALAIVGGAKFTTKARVLDTLLAAYDHVFIGGALADDFLAGQGYEIGKSLASGAEPDTIRALLSKKKLVLPMDVRVVPAHAMGSIDMYKQLRTAGVRDVKPDEVILDVGPASSALLADLARDSKTILWNGPLGNYENGFTDATDALARAIAATGAQSVVGGGDTVASIERLGLIPRFSFVSTGGGAMLEFLAKGTLPGIAVLESSES